MSGVLTTAYNDEYHVGIGVNLNAAPLEKAISLSKILGREICVDEFAEKLSL